MMIQDRRPEAVHPVLDAGDKFLARTDAGAFKHFMAARVGRMCKERARKL